MLRFATSPTGDMHIGDLYVAVLNYIVAKQREEQLLVRIDDSDSEKNIEGKDTEIMMILEKFAIKHDSVYHQSERLSIHQTLAIRLLQEKKAFICKCIENESKSVTYRYNGRCEALTNEDYKTIRESGEPFVIRLRKPKESITDIDSFVIIETDNTPTSIFASACDDMLNSISLIIRNKEHLEITAKEIHIKSSLGYKDETQYLHIPIISNIDKSYSIKWLLKEGFIPDAILNYLILLGNSKSPKEIFTLPEAIEWFNIEDISEDAKFDITKLKFINCEHLRLMDDKQLSGLFGFADADIGKLAKLYLEECNTTNELEAKIRPIFKPKSFDGEWGEQMRIIENIIANAPYFETLNQLAKHITKQSGLKDENLFKPLQLLLTGAKNSPKLSEIYPLIKSYILEVAS